MAEIEVFETTGNPFARGADYVLHFAGCKGAGLIIGAGAESEPQVVEASCRLEVADMLGLTGKVRVGDCCMELRTFEERVVLEVKDGVPIPERERMEPRADAWPELP